jgi:hypothetical protein
MKHRPVTQLLETNQQPTNVPIADLQPLGRFDLADLLPLDLV